MLIGQDRVWAKPANISLIANAESLSKSPFSGMAVEELRQADMFFWERTPNKNRNEYPLKIPVSCDEKEDGYTVEPSFQLYRKPIFSPGPLLSFANKNRSTPVHGQIGLYATAGIPLYGAHDHNKKRAQTWADRVPAHHKQQKKSPLPPTWY